MNYKLVFRLLGRLLLIEAALMAPSLAVALIYGQGDAMAFVITMALTAACGAALKYLLKPRREDLNPRDGMAVAGLTWVILSFFGALPFVISGAIPHLADAYFEAVSGFTTTGSTILTEIEHLPRGVLFWRSFTHWIGGMGVLVLTLAVLPRLSGRTSHLARAESPGPTFSKLLPKMGDTAKILYLLYFILSFTETGLSPSSRIAAFSTVPPFSLQYGGVSDHPPPKFTRSGSLTSSSSVTILASLFSRSPSSVAARIASDNAEKALATSPSSPSAVPT